MVLHKQQLLLEEKKKKAMDMHLEFIVDQTAKYSDWLVKGLTTSSTATPSEASLHSAGVSIEGQFLPLLNLLCIYVNDDQALGCPQSMLVPAYEFGLPLFS